MSHPTQILPFTTVDVFTSSAYTGNPLAIVHVPSSLSALLTQSQKQLIAREFNLSETIFLHDSTGDELEWTVDIFTTADELPFAGHPIIGAAVYVLLLHQQSGSGMALGAGSKGRFITKAGVVHIAASDDGRSVVADVPHEVHIHVHTIGDLQGPVSGLSNNGELRQAEMVAPIVSIVKGMTFLLVNVGSLELLGQVESGGVRDVNFHGLLDKSWNGGFVARYYFVVLGWEEGRTVRVRSRMVELTMEDPATGSAACALGCWLALQGSQSMKFEVEQGVEMGRKSVIGVDVKLDKEERMIESVRLSGEAVRVMEGIVRI